MPIDKELSEEQQTERDNFGDNISKNIDLAIEAQDGPTETKKPEDETKAPEEGGTPKPDDSESGTGDVAAQPKPKEEGKEEQKPTHTPKDLTLTDGTVVKGGAERRFYEQREAARQRASALETDLSKTRTDFSALQEKYTTLESTVKDLHGADPTHVKLGLQIIADLQRDPPGTMKKLLAETIAQGYTVEEIGAGVDAAAIQRMIEDRLPKQEPSDEERVANLTKEATEEATTFFNSYPDAKPHDALLARMLRDNPDLAQHKDGLRIAYFQLKDAFAEKGFDWNLPLEENLKQSGLATEQGIKDETNKDKLPLPSGGSGGDNLQVKSTDLAHESEDTGDIVKAAMREAGMKID